MEQVDFAKLFSQSEYIPLEYSLRTNSNFDHDIVFLASYLHDTKIFLELDNFQKGKLTLHLERITWELLTETNHNMLLCSSRLEFFNVVDYSYWINRAFLKKNRIPKFLGSERFIVETHEKNIEVKFISRIAGERTGFVLSLFLKGKMGKYLTLIDDAILP